MQERGGCPQLLDTQQLCGSRCWLVFLESCGRLCTFWCYFLAHQVRKNHSTCFFGQVTRVLLECLYFCFVFFFSLGFSEPDLAKCFSPCLFLNLILSLSDITVLQSHQHPWTWASTRNSSGCRNTLLTDSCEVGRTSSRESRGQEGR